MYTKEKLIEQYNGLTKSFGRKPLKKEFFSDRTVLRTARIETIKKYFGSWENFAREATSNNRSQKRNPKYSDNELLWQLQVLTGYLGRKPTQEEFEASNETAPMGLVVERFGSWNEFLKAGGLTR